MKGRIFLKIHICIQKKKKPIIFQKDFFLYAFSSVLILRHSAVHTFSLHSQMYRQLHFLYPFAGYTCNVKDPIYLDYQSILIFIYFANKYPANKLERKKIGINICKKKITHKVNGYIHLNHWPIIDCLQYCLSWYWWID